MSFDIIDKIGVVLGFIPFVLGIYYWLITYRPARRFLSFSSNEEIDIIVTISDFKKDEKGLSIKRATTGIGQIKGIASAARLIGRLYRKKSVNVQLSGIITQRPDKDLIVLGGPAKNNISKKLIEIFKSKNSEISFEFNDVSPKIKLDDFTVSEPDLDLNGDGEIDKDYAIVISWKNPFAVKDRRVIMCAGFTSYGTAGGAIWLFEDMLMQSGWKLKKLNGLTNYKKSNFVAVIEIRIASGQVIGTECVKISEIKTTANKVHDVQTS